MLRNRLRMRNLTRTCEISLPAKSHLSEFSGVERILMADVTVMAPGFALALLLLSPVMHWGVLINTNAWYGCEEGILTLTMEVFAPRKLCYAYTYASRGSGAFVHTPEVIHITSGSPTTPTC